MGMIKSEREYQVSKKKVTEMETMIKETKTKKDTSPFANAGLFGVEAFKTQIQEELKEYKNIKAGKIPKEYLKMENLGLLLIALRIKNGLSQTDLAEKLKVAPSQVSRDENNDYHGVSLPTIKKILEAMNETLEIKLI